MPFELFSHAASRWGTSQGENLATSGLVYLVNTYPEAQGRFCSDLAALTAQPEGGLRLRFTEQLVTSAGGGRVDAAGITPTGDRVLAVECKFDAVLHEAVITGYLDDVIPGGILLLVVPRQRRAEAMVQAARALDRQVTDFAERDGYLYVPAGGKTVAVTDWVSLLSSLAASSTDLEFAAEVKQLRAYVDQMTGDEYTPLTPDELSSQRGARWRHFYQLFEEAAALAQAKGILKFEGNLAGTHGGSGRGLRFGPWLAWGGLHADSWEHVAATPLWLDFSGGAGRPPLDVALGALRALDVDIPRVFVRREHALVALYLKCGSDRGDVVTDLVDQLRAVRQAIPAEQPAMRS